MVNRKKPNNKINKQDKQLNMVIVGVILIFLSIIAIFNWGFMGIIYVNVYRLIVGEAYPLMLVLLAYIGVMMVVKGNNFKYTIKGLIGTLLIFLAICTSLHFNEFFPQEPLVEDIISTTYGIFENELLTNQIKVSLGGGMLGAISYQSFGYLFGRWGTYLLSFVLFSIGLILVENFNIKQLKNSVNAIHSFNIGLFGQSKETIQSIKSISKDIDESTDKVDHINKNHNTKMGTINNVAEYESSQSSWIDKVKNIFDINDTESAEYSESNFEPEIELTHSSYEPSLKDYKKNQWDTFRKSDSVASTARKVKRFTIDEKVLDLDYFDEMNSINSEFKNEEEIIVSNADQSTSSDLSVQSEENNDVTNNSLDSIHYDEKESHDLSTEHWQSQATRTQRLTDDEVEKTLDTAKTISVQVSKPKTVDSQEYILPGVDLLTERPPVDQTNEYRKINQNISKLEQTFESFGVDAKVVKANLGPAVTKYEIEPAVGVKVSKIVSLTDDIALSLAARDIRMEAPIPGKSLIGIEVPNSQISPVSFNEIVGAALESQNILEVPLGRDVSGSISTADLSKMPHLLIAGSTGSGKSVGMNVIICSLLMKAKPEDVKFLMIDPKKVELTMYNEIPHLLAPVVTNPRKAAKALNQVVEEMEQRYEKFAEVNVRNQESYNEYIDKLNQQEGTGYEKMPKIVVFIDELADLMLVAGNEVENAIIRLAQMARAAGIHMIIATQRPSVDVITGIIKANIPSRLAFAVTSGTDSRTILDSNGAEKLLGKGDMLFQPISMNKPVRVQGAYISDEEVERITNYIKAQRTSEYDESMIISDEQMNQADVSEDEYFDEAVDLIKDQETVSISQLQRKFRIGYNRAARLIDDLEALGYIGPADGSKPRQVYINES